MGEYIDLLSKLQKDYQRLEDLRTSNIKEHERTFNSSEHVRLLILQQEQAILRKVEEEQCELERQLTALQEANQISLQEGISKIDQKQEQILLLCSKLQTLINSGGKHIGAREIRDEIAKIFPKEKSFNITLKKPQFAPRLQQGLKLGKIVSEERSIQFSFSSLCQGGEMRSPSITGEQKCSSVQKCRVKTGNTTLSEILDINSTFPWQNLDCDSISQSYALVGDPSRAQDDFFQDSMEDQVNWKGSDGERLSEEGMLPLKSSGNKISLRVSDCQTVPSPNTESYSTIGSKAPGSEGCGRCRSSEKVNISASWLDGGCVPHTSPEVLEKLEVLEQRNIAVPLTVRASWIKRDPSTNRATDIPGPVSSQCPDVQISGQSGPDRNYQTPKSLAEDSTSSSVTFNDNFHIQRDQQPISTLSSVTKNKPEPALGSQTMTSPANAHEDSTTQVHPTASVPNTDLHNPFSQLRNSHCTVTHRNKANQSNPTDHQDCLGGDSTSSSSPLETSSPFDCESIFRVTAAFISDEDSECSTFTEQSSVTNTKALKQTEEKDPELCLAEAICASHMPSAWQGSNLLKMSCWTSMDSISKASAKQGSGRIAARGTGTLTIKKRFKKNEFSKSCLDLSANNSQAPVIPELRMFSDPEEDKLERLSQRTSSPSESLDSSDTFLINSPRGIDERKKITIGASKAESPSKSVQCQPKGRYRSHFTKTDGCEAHKRGSSQTRIAKGRSSEPNTTLRASLSSGSFPNSEERPSLTGHHRMSRVYSSVSAGQKSRFQSRVVTRKPQPPFQGNRKILTSKISPSNYSRSLSLACSGASAEVGGWMVASGHCPTESPRSSLGATKARSKSEANLSFQVQRGALFFKNELVGQFGRYGCGRADLNLPYGIHTTPQGAMYVVDYGNKRLQAMNRKGDVTQQVGLERGAYFDVAVNNQGLLALTSIPNKSVDVYSRHGKLLSVITENFQNPRGITANICGQFLITDTKRGTISVLTLDPRTAQRIDNNVVSGFNKPYFISTNCSEHVAVSERGFDGGCCVKVLDRDLQVLGVLGSTKSSLTIELSNPWGICIDDQGNVLVVDWGRRHTIILFPPQGPACTVVEDGLRSPRGLGLVQDGHIAVVDSMHNCIKVFRYR
uniref:uro-adherence factor A n=1 Tax=Pristiophorus japonicus TaxID=55135 RepID=UPI00398EF857